jgi:hypothetical protein
MRSVHAKFHKFRKHRGEDTNLSSFLFSELERIAYIKDVVLCDGIPTKFISYILELYFYLI